MPTEKTCARRRLAMQLAIQLPEKTADARMVLRMTSELLDEFMIDSEARRRARRLGWDLSPVAAAARRRFTLPTCAAPIGWSLAILWLTLPLGELSIYCFGRGSVLVLALGVMAAALVFGRAGALALAIAGPLVHNFMMMPPSLQFSIPTANEWAGVLLGLATALLVPTVERFRGRLRDLTIGESKVPDADPAALRQLLG